jgi:hypothetical protein
MLKDLDWYCSRGQEPPRRSSVPSTSRLSKRLCSLEVFGGCCVIVEIVLYFLVIAIPHMVAPIFGLAEKL